MGILQVFDEFFEPVASNVRPQPGHIFWVPTSEVYEVPRILDVKRATPDEHWATEFEISEINNVHFKSRERLPIKKLNLEESEELLIAKAKKRPAIIIAIVSTDGLKTLPDGVQKRMANHLEKCSYLVAPFYSVSSFLEPGTFGPILVARIRALQYLHFFCVPDPNKPGVPGSIIRLDRVFPTYLGRGCESYRGLRLHEEPFEILLSQFSLLTGKGYREPLEMARELVQDALPDELRA